MNIIGIGSSQFINFVPHVSSPASQAAGQDNMGSKKALLPPIEPLTNPSQTKNRESEQTLAAIDADERGAAIRQDLQQVELRQISKLAARDREVRAHEQAHSSVGGQYVGAPSFQYSKGPNGVSYAVAGEVSISAPRSTGDPEITLRAAEQIRRAALAPAAPSEQDRRVATQAIQTARQAQVEIERLVVAEREAEDGQAVSESEQAKQEREQAPNEQDALSQRQQALSRSVRLGERLAGSAVERGAVGILLDQRA